MLATTLIMSPILYLWKMSWIRIHKSCRSNQGRYQVIHPSPSNLATHFPDLVAPLTNLATNLPNLATHLPDLATHLPDLASAWSRIQNRIAIKNQ